jgi:hypothetical protein
MSHLPDKEIYQQLQAALAEARLVLLVHFTTGEEPAGLAEVLPQLGALGIITGWTLAPDDLTLECAPDASERLQQLIITTPKKPADVREHLQQLIITTPQQPADQSERLQQLIITTPKERPDEM